MESQYKFNGLWIPESGYFILADISGDSIEEKYFKSDAYGQAQTRDIAFVNQQAYQRKVISIPCSFFYQPHNLKEGENIVRYAFCKDEEMIREAGKNLK